MPVLDLVEKVLTAAKIVGLTLPVQDASPAFYRINVTSTTVGATVLMTAVKQTSEGRSSVPRDTFGTSHL